MSLSNRFKKTEISLKIKKKTFVKNLRNIYSLLNL